jgi:protein SCO1/2
VHKTTLVGLTIALLVSLWLTACGQSGPSFRGNGLPTPIPAPDFKLTDQYGQSFRLSDQRGKVVLLFFGYTNCPDVCPTTLATWKQVYDALGDDANRVRFVFITVDPERDTPERLQQHLAIFNPNFIGLTGLPEELERVYKAYGIYHEKDTSSETAAGYLVNHSASVLLLDADGRWRENFPFGTPAEDVVHDIRELLER